jgi:serine/threonine-protein kinase
LATSDFDLAPGQMVGEYRIERKIGEGGFGKVYAAVHPVIGKAAAVKVLNPALARSQEMVSRFVSEARAVNQIRHRNIIDIFSFGTLPGGLNYFVMELLEGMTLDAYVKRNGPLDPGLALSILWPIGKALVAAHKAGIAHRDLKPENVFLVIDQDGSMFPKLLDFGIAKLLHEGEMAHRTRTGAMMGTPIYMSPEQCKGAGVDHRSDIYSFGVMTHEVLTGKRPFEANSMVELLVKQVSEPAPPMSSSRPGLPRSLDAAVLHMLEKSADKRPESMQAALDELLAAARAAGIEVPGAGQAPGSVVAPARASAPAPQPASVQAAAHASTAEWLAAQRSGATGQAGQSATGSQGAPSAALAMTPAPMGQSAAMSQGAPSAVTPPPVAMSTPHGASQSYAQQPSQGAYPASRQERGSWSSMAPQTGAQGAPQGQGGYPPGGGAYATLQSAGALPPQSAGAPARRPSGVTGIYAAIAGGLLVLFLVGLLFVVAVGRGGSEVEIGTEAPPVGATLDRDTTGKLDMRFTPPGASAPQGSMELQTHRSFRVTVQTTGGARVLRAHVQYADSSIRTKWTGQTEQSEESPTAHKGFDVVNDGGTLVVSKGGGRANDREEKDVLEDVGELFRPRPAVLARKLEVGDTLLPPSEVVVDLLNLGGADPGQTIRADNASFKLVSVDSDAGKAEFEVAFRFVLDEERPPLHIESPLTGKIRFDVKTGLPAAGALEGPLEGTFTDNGVRFGVSGTMRLETK